MQDFIQNVMSRLGISQDQAQSATGGIMNMLQQQMNPQDFQQLQDKLPGSQEVMQQSAVQQQAPVQQPSQGGLGAIAQSVMQSAGGAGGVMGAIGGLLNSTGLNANQGKSFVTMLLDYVRNKAGSGMLDKIIQQVPGLQALSPMATSQK